MDLSRLGTYNTVTEANLVKAKLNAFGIEAVVEADDAGSMVPNLDLVRGVRVLVRDDDLAEAYEVLERALPAGD
jgi:hypothetical protein